MSDQNVPTPDKNDKKEIAVIIAIGIIVIVCICCLLSVAGYYLYEDVKTNLSPNNRTTPKPATAATAVPANVSQFGEAFNSNKNDWAEGTFDDEYGTTTFTINGQYEWDVTAAKSVNQKSWATAAPIFKDFVASVEATHVDGVENASYGILFRIQDAYNLYYYSISDVGYYYVGLLHSGEWTTLIDWTETSYINVNASNILKVAGDGNNYTFYINEIKVDSINDSTFSNGTAGLAIELYETGDTSTFAFDNFTYKIP